MNAPVGRPTKYKPEYCQAVIEVMREGVSLTAFAGSIGVARSSINEWIDKFPEFSEAVNVGKAACAAWYNLRARDVVMNGGSGAQATLIVFGLKNMDADSWRDKQEISGPEGGAIQVVINRSVV